MGLRKLTGGPTPLEGAKPLGRSEPKSEPDRAASLDEAADAPVVYPIDDAAELETESLAPAVATELQTPPALEDFESELPDREPSPLPESPAPAPAPARSVDAFMASLEALRATLRGGPIAAPIDATPEVATAPEKTDQRTPLPPIVTASVEANANASALEGTPLPSAIEGPTPTPRPLLQDRTEAAAPKKNGAARNYEPRETPSLESALQAVRAAVPGLNLTPPKTDTPVNGRERPASDGIPKSVSEDLPKYPARPRMRTCNRCGHETKLRDAKCQKCSHVDESLGILDSLIAGDLARVEQVLLVRPHLITMRTSRHDWTLLHMAASGGNPKMVDLLIDKGVSVNAVNRDGKTALHYAAAKGHAGIVQTLLKNLADATMLYNGKSALDLARKHSRKEIEDILRRHLAGE